MGKFEWGFVLGMFFMGILETCVPGIGYHDAGMAKMACEKSLPRDQVCVPFYLPSPTKGTP